MTGSHDPDVIASNKSCIRIEVFCYPAKEAQTYEGQTADQLRSRADRIASNRCDEKFVITLCANKN